MEYMELIQIHVSGNAHTFAIHDKQDDAVGLGHIFLNEVLDELNLTRVLSVANIVDYACNNDKRLDDDTTIILTRDIIEVEVVHIGPLRKDTHTVFGECPSAVSQGICGFGACQVEGQDIFLRLRNRTTNLVQVRQIGAEWNIGFAARKTEGDVDRKWGACGMFEPKFHWTSVTQVRTCRRYLWIDWVRALWMFQRRAGVSAGRQCPVWVKATE